MVFPVDVLWSLKRTHVKVAIMSDDSASSESDSEISDTEEFAENVANVFQSMRQSISNCNKAKSTQKPTNSRSAYTSKTGKKQTVRLTPRSVYQTFQTSKKPINKGSTEDVDKDDPDNVTHFFIDKGPSVNSSTDEIGVISYNLTNINDSVSDVNDNEPVEEKDHIEEVSKDSLNFNQLQEILDNSKIKDFRPTCSNSSYPAMDSDDGLSDESDSEDDSLAAKKEQKKNFSALSSNLQSGLAMNDIYLDVNPLGKSKSNQKYQKQQQKQTEPEVMKKSVITEDFESQESIATTHVSVRQMKKQRKLEREKTKGGKWYNMPATEMTEERKHDLAVLQMRKVLDPKRFYKANDLKTTPKYFQFGTVVEDATDFYSSRIPKKQRKSTIVEELLADAEFRKFNKRKYAEIQDAKRQGKGPYKHMKRLKKRKK